MKKCNDCNIEMIENTDLHTDYVGGIDYEEQIYVDYSQGEKDVKSLFGVSNRIIKRVKARVCPKCGKVELYVDLENNN